MKINADHPAQLVDPHHGDIRPDCGQIDTCIPVIHREPIREEQRLATSALVIAQGEAPLILNSPGMTPCFNVGSTARYLSTASCIQSALRVPVNMRILLDLKSPTLNCILLLARVRKLGTRILLPPALLSKQQDSPQLPQRIVNPFRATQAHQTRSVLFT